MKLKKLTIENFRGILHLDLDLDELTVLIGENNTGKSTVLEALRFVLTRGLGTRKGGQLAEYDFHLLDAASTPRGAKPVGITLHFREDVVSEWPASVVQQLGDYVQPDPVTELSNIWLKLAAQYDDQSQQVETSWLFCNSLGNELPRRGSNPLPIFQKLVPLFFLSALRDASQEFSQRGQFWSGFLKSAQLPDADRDRLEQMLQQINGEVVGANQGLTQVIQQIAAARNLVPLHATEPVVLEAISTSLFDTVGKLQVHLRTTTGAKLPLHRHGEGTQSLAVLMLFQAFIKANLAELFDPDSSPILALEEPEAHLHPSAIRALGTFLKELDGQIVVSSHSGDLVSRVPLKSIRRLYKRNGETLVGQVPSGILTAAEEQAIDYNIRINRGAYLFSRCWLLVEGATDFHLMPLLAEMMGYSQDSISYAVIEISQAVGKGEPFIKFAKALGIQWFLMVDNDSAGKGYAKRAAGYLNPGETLTDRVRNLTFHNIEQEFWHNGFDGFILALVPNKRNAAIAKEAGEDRAKELKLRIESAIDNAGGKQAFAQALAVEVQRRGVSTIPQALQDTIIRIVQLSGGAQ